MPALVHLKDEAATLAFGQRLARVIGAAGGVIALHGDLGAGKTTLVRGLIRSLGYTGIVTSPTYTLMEPYALAERTVFHLDLYRLAEAEELAMLGLRDIDLDRDLLLVEWPEQGAPLLPAIDLTLWLADAPSAQGRVLRAEPASDQGRGWWQALQQQWAATT